MLSSDSARDCAYKTHKNAGLWVVEVICASRPSARDELPRLTMQEIPTDIHSARNQYGLSDASAMYAHSFGDCEGDKLNADDHSPEMLRILL